jgi:hypothetical protein
VVIVAQPAAATAGAAVLQAISDPPSTTPGLSDDEGALLGAIRLYRRYLSPLKALTSVRAGASGYAQRSSGSGRSTARGSRFADPPLPSVPRGRARSVPERSVGVDR